MHNSQQTNTVSAALKSAALGRRQEEAWEVMVMWVGPCLGCQCMPMELFRHQPPAQCDATKQLRGKDRPGESCMHCGRDGPPCFDIPTNSADCQVDGLSTSTFSAVVSLIICVGGATLCPRRLSPNQRSFSEQLPEGALRKHTRFICILLMAAQAYLGALSSKGENNLTEKMQTTQCSRTLSSAASAAASAADYRYPFLFFLFSCILFFISESCRYHCGPRKLTRSNTSHISASHSGGFLL